MFQFQGTMYYVLIPTCWTTYHIEIFQGYRCSLIHLKPKTKSIFTNWDIIFDDLSLCFTMYMHWKPRIHFDNCALFCLFLLFRTKNQHGNHFAFNFKIPCSSCVFRWQLFVLDYEDQLLLKLPVHLSELLKINPEWQGKAKILIPYF